MKKLIATILMIATMISIFPVLPVSAASWEDGWSITNEGGIEKDEFGLIVYPTDRTIGSSTTLSKTLKKPAAIDYTMVMTVEEWQETMVDWTNESYFHMYLYFNQCRTQIYIYQNGITLWDGTAWSTRRAADIGTGTHTYRFVSENPNKITLYLDGKKFQEVALKQQADFTPSVSISVQNVLYIDYFGETADKAATAEPEDTGKEETPEVIVENELTLPETKGFYYDFEDPNEEVLPGWTGLEKWKIEDGCLTLKTETTNGGYNNSIIQDKKFNPKGDFTWSFRMRAVDFDAMAIKTLTKGVRTFWRIFHSVMDIQIVNEKQVSRKMPLSSKDYIGVDVWHEYKVESTNNGRYYRYYVDDELIGEERGYDYGMGLNDPERYLYLSCSTSEGSGNAKFEIDWMKLETNLSPDRGLEMVSPQAKYVDTGDKNPAKNAVYVEGTDIELQAKPAEGYEKYEIPQVDYKMNGKVVATGYAPDYKAVFKNAPAGSHSIIAEGGGFVSHETYFDVVPEIKADLKTKWQSGDKLNISLANVKKATGVASVDFLVDGQVVATDKTAPYSATATGVKPESHTVAAIFRSASGQELKAYYANVVSNIGNGNSVNYSNEIRYTVSGNSGSATVDVSNGTHRVFMTHKANEVTMLTLDGEETHPYGVGEYVVITNGPTVDVYRNGQFAFSCYLPKTSAVEKKSKDNGLKVTNLKITLPENRDNYFVKRNVTDKAKVYDLQGLSDYFHNFSLDFVASKDDNARLVLQDGYYVADIVVENGEISAKEAVYNGNDPTKVVLGKLPENGSDAYVRIAIVDGMAMALVDGKWVCSFRCTNSVGKQSLGVDVTKGSLPYVSVNRYTDYYLYEDDFKGKGEFDALDYFEAVNLQANVDTNAGNMVLYTSGEGLARLSGFVDEFEITTEMTVNSALDMVGFQFGDMVIDDIYQRIGYNFKTKQYEFIDRWEKTIKKHTAPGTLPTGKKIKMTLKVTHTDEDKFVDLYVDGKKVISGDIAEGKNRGRVALLVNNSVVTVDSIKFMADSRSNPMTRSVLDKNRKGHGGSGPNYPDGSFTDAAGYGIVDGGAAWTFVGHSLGGHTAPQQHATPDGDWIATQGTYYVNEKGNNVWSYNVYNSDDVYNLTKELVAENVWHQEYLGLPENGNYGNTGDRLRVGPSGRAYWPASMPNYTDENGVYHQASSETANEETLFYSDDKGKTWTKTETLLATNTPIGSVVAESTAIELPNGVVRLFFRTNRGWLRYIDSYDRGKTFDYDSVRSTPFISTTNCYSIRYGYKTYNSYDYDTLYITWGHDDSNQSGQVQCPRTRFSMARSTDGGETWEFLGTFWEKNYEAATITNMNVWMGAAQDYLYAAVDTTIGTQSDIAVAKGGARMVINMDAVKGTKAFETVHTLCDYNVEMCRIMPQFKIDRVLVANETTGNALLQGESLAGAVANGAILVDVAATYAGARLGKAANGGVTFTRGDEVVTFDASKITKKNGKQYISISAFADAYGYNVEKTEDITFISPFGGWSEGQLDAFRYATDIFANVK